MFIIIFLVTLIYGGSIMKRSSPEIPRVHTYTISLDSHLTRGRELTCELVLCTCTYKDGCVSCTYCMCSKNDYQWQYFLCD